MVFGSLRVAHLAVQLCKRARNSSIEVADETVPKIMKHFFFYFLFYMFLFNLQCMCVWEVEYCNWILKQIFQLIELKFCIPTRLVCMVVINT